MKNVILETNKGKKLQAHIVIDGVDNWDISDKGIVREYRKERQVADNNPVNIEKITFLINGKQCTFVASQKIKTKTLMSF